jgi:hypothetical protein
MGACAALKPCAPPPSRSRRHRLPAQRDVVLFGRRVAQPRLVAYMADADTPPYSYTGLVLQPAPWSEVSAGVGRRV